MFWPKTSDVAEAFFLITIQSLIAEHQPIMIGRRYQRSPKAAAKSTLHPSHRKISSLRVASDQLHQKTAPKLAFSFKLTPLANAKKKDYLTRSAWRFLSLKSKNNTPVMTKHFDFHSFLIHLVGKKNPHKRLRPSTSNHPLLSLWLITNTCLVHTSLAGEAV